MGWANGQGSWATSARGKDYLSIHRPQGQCRQTIVGHEQLSSSLGLSLPIVKGAV